MLLLQAFIRWLQWAIWPRLLKLLLLELSIGADAVLFLEALPDLLWFAEIQWHFLDRLYLLLISLNEAFGLFLRNLADHARQRLDSLKWLFRRLGRRNYQILVHHILLLLDLFFLLHVDLCLKPAELLLRKSIKYSFIWHCLLGWRRSRRWRDRFLCSSSRLRTFFLTLWYGVLRLVRLRFLFLLRCILLFDQRLLLFLLSWWLLGIGPLFFTHLWRPFLLLRLSDGLHHEW